MHVSPRLAAVALLALSSCARPTGAGGDGDPTGHVACHPDRTDVLTPVVRAQVDGVHLRLDNRTTRQVFVYRRRDGEVRSLEQLRPGVVDVVVSEGPGAWEVVCIAPADYPGEDDAWAPLEVVDPAGLWIPDRLGCEAVTGTHPDHREDFEEGTPAGVAGVPPDLARRDIPSSGFDLAPGDVVERAGYPEALPRLVRVVRDGRVVAVARYADDGTGRWIFRGVEWCEEGGPPRLPEPA